MYFNLKYRIHFLNMAPSFASILNFFGNLMSKWEIPSQLLILPYSDETFYQFWRVLKTRSRIFTEWRATRWLPPWRTGFHFFLTSSSRWRMLMLKSFGRQRRQRRETRRRWIGCRAVSRWCIRRFLWQPRTWLLRMLFLALCIVQWKLLVNKCLHPEKWFFLNLHSTVIISLWSKMGNMFKFFKARFTFNIKLGSRWQNFNKKNGRKHFRIFNFFKRSGKKRKRRKKFTK